MAAMQGLLTSARSKTALDISRLVPPRAATAARTVVARQARGQGPGQGARRAGGIYDIQVGCKPSRRCMFCSLASAAIRPETPRHLHRSRLPSACSYPSRRSGPSVLMSSSCLSARKFLVAPWRRCCFFAYVNQVGTCKSFGSAPFTVLRQCRDDGCLASFKLCLSEWEVMALANGSTTPAHDAGSVARPDARREWRNRSGTTIRSQVIQGPTLGQELAIAGAWCLWRSDGDRFIFRLQTPETTSRAAAVAHNVLSAAECHGAGFASSHAAGHSSSGRSHGWPVSLPRQYSRRGAHAIWCTGVRTPIRVGCVAIPGASNGTKPPAAVLVLELLCAKCLEGTQLPVHRLRRGNGSGSGVQRQAEHRHGRNERERQAEIGMEEASVNHQNPLDYNSGNPVGAFQALQQGHAHHAWLS